MTAETLRKPILVPRVLYVHPLPCRLRRDRAALCSRAAMWEPKVSRGIPM